VEQLVVDFFARDLLRNAHQLNALPQRVHQIPQHGQPQAAAILPLVVGHAGDRLVVIDADA
jgi:hypothetical protein